MSEIHCENHILLGLQKSEISDSAQNSMNFDMWMNAILDMSGISIPEHYQNLSDFKNALCARCLFYVRNTEYF